MNMSELGAIYWAARAAALDEPRYFGVDVLTLRFFREGAPGNVEDYAAILPAGLDWLPAEFDELARRSAVGAFMQYLRGVLGEWDGPLDLALSPDRPGDLAPTDLYRSARRLARALEEAAREAGQMRAAAARSGASRGYLEGVRRANAAIYDGFVRAGDVRRWAGRPDMAASGAAVADFLRLAAEGVRVGADALRSIPPAVGGGPRPYLKGPRARLLARLEADYSRAGLPLGFSASAASVPFGAFLAGLFGHFAGLIDRGGRPGEAGHFLHDEGPGMASPEYHAGAVVRVAGLDGPLSAGAVAAALDAAADAAEGGELIGRPCHMHGVTETVTHEGGTENG